MKLNYSLIFISVVGFFFIGCDSTKYVEFKTDFNDDFWHIDSIPKYEFEILDRSKPYKIILNVRNSINYDYSNLYLKFHLVNSQSDTIESKLQNFYLFNPKTGQPRGSGIGDIFETKLILLDSTYFPLPGNYSIGVQHQMRSDSLKGILSVGARVEYHK